MDFLPYTLKWLELVLRWAHVLFAILWVGNSFLFNYLDNKLNKNITSNDIDGEGYLMHSGYYYKLTRLKTKTNERETKITEKKSSATWLKIERITKITE